MYGHPVIASLHEFELSQKFHESFVTQARKFRRKVSGGSTKVLETPIEFNNLVDLFELAIGKDLTGK